MHCKKCGQVIDDDSRFCRHCGMAQQAGAPVFASEPEAEPSISTPRKVNNNGRAVGIGLAALLGLVMIGRCHDGATAPPSPTSTPEIASTAATPATPPTPEKEPEAENWVYATDEDKVRGATTYVARTVSTNRIQQDPPYDGGTSMVMTVRKHPRWGTDVYLTISEGQMMCPSYSGCSGMVRFDNAPAQRVRFTGPEDSSSEVVFVEGAKAFIAKLKKAKRVTIEKTLYQAGAPQFEFDVAGLKWAR